MTLITFCGWSFCTMVEEIWNCLYFQASGLATTNKIHIIEYFQPYLRCWVQLHQATYKPIRRSCNFIVTSCPLLCCYLCNDCQVLHVHQGFMGLCACSQMLNELTSWLPASLLNSSLTLWFCGKTDGFIPSSFLFPADSYILTFKSY